MISPWSTILITIMAGAMTLMTMVLKKKTMMKTLKTPFECGFSTSKNPLMPFSSQFFMVAVMFIIFDVEISMILSLMMSIKKFPTKMWIKSALFFMVMMQATLLYEMKMSAMKWMT